MKIRNGFVSNSSSSSFCILGISISKLKDNLNTFGLLENFKEDSDEIYLKNLFKEGLEYQYGIDTYAEEIIIGQSVNDLDNNKTIKEIKIDVANKINNCMNCQLEMKDISFHTDGGFEG